MPEFSVIIPAFNEEKTIVTAIAATSRVFEQLGKSFEIIVVDDGSTDKTANIVEDFVMARRAVPVHLIRHAKNQGKGAAVRTGALAAQGGWIVFLDSDLAAHPSEIAKAIPVLDDSDIIIGSRRVAGADIAERQPVYRHWLGRLFNLFIRIYLGLPFRDTQCGFKIFNKKMRPLFESLKSTGWTFDVELLYRARHQGLRIREIPVTWRHGRDSRVRLGHVWDILSELRRIKKQH